jgi:hypothetical protein
LLGRVVCVRPRSIIRPPKPQGYRETHPAVLEARALQQLADLLVQPALLWYPKENIVRLQIRGSRGQHGCDGDGSPLLLPSLPVVRL